MGQGQDLLLLDPPNPEDSDPHIQGSLAFFPQLTLSRNTLTDVPKGPLSSSWVFHDLTKPTMESVSHTGSSGGLVETDSHSRIPQKPSKA